MIQIDTNRRLQVSTDGDAGPYLMIPVAQLDELKSVLDRNHVHYLVDPEAITLDGEPEIAIVNLGRHGNAARVQQILDGEE